MSVLNDDNFESPIGESATNATGTETSSNSTIKPQEDYVRPRIIRENRQIGEVDFQPDDLDGDAYFEPAIVRAATLKHDDRLAKLFTFDQTCPILFSDLIQALNSID